MQRSVYLAGPIKGLTYEVARLGWRLDFVNKLDQVSGGSIVCRSPMRAKQFLKDQGAISGRPDAYASEPLATQKGITTRDRNDVLSCDAMVANFLGAERLSGGTAIEFGWADLARKPIVMVIEKNGIMESGLPNPHWHPMFNEIAGYIVQDLDEAAYIVNHILTPGI